MGLVGSFHCLGMCSPLVMVVSQHQPFPFKRLLYNLGRISTYAVLGLIAASFGALFDFQGFQKSISIGLGLLLIVVGITGMGHWRIPFLTQAMQQLTLFLKARFSSFLSNKNKLAVLALGMINGLLPCGLIYLAIAYCVSFQPMQGMLFMFVFGLATFPVMFGAPALFSKLVQNMKLSFRKVTTVVMITAGVLLLARSYMVHTPATSTMSDGITVCK